MSALFDFLLSQRGTMYFTRRFGSDSLIRYAMDYKFRSGDWGSDSVVRNSFVIDLVEKSACGGKILQLGCCAGRLIALVSESSYAFFTGLDLSPLAIEAAKKRKLSRTHFELGDMHTHHWDDRFELILFDESIYYLKTKGFAASLQRLLGYLQPGGRVVVTICQPNRFRRIINHIQQHYFVLDEGAIPDSPQYFLVFQPLSDGG